MLLKNARNLCFKNDKQLKNSTISKLNLVSVSSPEEQFLGETLINLRSLRWSPHYKSQQKFNILNKVKITKVN